MPPIFGHERQRILTKTVSDILQKHFPGKTFLFHIFTFFYVSKSPIVSQRFQTHFWIQKILGCCCGGVSWHKLHAKGPYHSTSMTSWPAVGMFIRQFFWIIGHDPYKFQGFPVNPSAPFGEQGCKWFSAATAWRWEESLATAAK